ncbi:FCD domain-containing protein [Rhodococcus jostii]|uniref:FCD domain-containing protein n=1 Tax=Rhodococcus jostii TaxID=132919 RepID=UPI001F0811B3|nr:FCD domain-containing protein [Rhodococcus jostii]
MTKRCSCPKRRSPPPPASPGPLCARHCLVEHRAIADTIAAEDPHAAVRAVREHLDTTLRSMKRPNLSLHEGNP